MRNDATIGQAPPADATPDDVVARLKEKIAPVDHWVRTLACEHPLVALGGAIGIGYLAGCLLRRL